jgi:carbon starvation protein CstA
LAYEGRAKFLPVTVLPMLFVAITTFTAGAEMLSMQINGLVTQLHNPPEVRNTALIVQASVLGGLIVAMLACGTIILIASAARVWKTLNGAPGSSRTLVGAMG